MALAKTALGLPRAMLNAAQLTIPVGKERVIVIMTANVWGLLSAAQTIVLGTLTRTTIGMIAAKMPPFRQNVLLRKTRFTYHKISLTMARTTPDKIMLGAADCFA